MLPRERYHGFKLGLVAALSAHTLGRQPGQGDPGVCAILHQSSDAGGAKGEVDVVEIYLRSYFDAEVVEVIGPC